MLCNIKSIVCFLALLLSVSSQLTATAYPQRSSAQSETTDKPSATKDDGKNSTSQSEQVMQLFELIKKERGDKPLKLDPILTDAAYNYATKLASSGDAVQNFKREELIEFQKKVGYKGESLLAQSFKGNADAKTMFDQLKISRDFQENLLDRNADQIGIARKDDTWVLGTGSEEVMKLFELIKKQRGDKPLELDPRLTDAAFNFAMTLKTEGVTQPYTREMMLSYQKEAGFQGKPMSVHFDQGSPDAKAVFEQLQNTNFLQTMLDPKANRIGIKRLPVPRDGEMSNIWVLQIGALKQ